ncbi:hypothetical protein NP568_25635, partial [Vibrio parahaemolyticus]|nr:hypothetical protein [Vibrio parahaemolyticus]
FFSASVWAVGYVVADQLHLMIEDLASCVETSGKIIGKAGVLWRGGRQSGLVLHSMFQRGEEGPQPGTEEWRVGGVGAV